MHSRIYHRWPLRLLAEHIRRRQFFAAHEWRGLHFGVFDSFAAAREYGARHGVAAHYDMDHTWWLGVQSSVHLHDYPTLYWLNRVLAEGSKIADLGGSVGVSYYACKTFLSVHASIEWLVCELPHVVEKGRALARERGANALHFTESFQDFEAHDVLLAAGALQYVDPTIKELLQTLRRPPRYLLINRIPVHESKAYVTLQNTGCAIAPSHVFNKKVFQSELQSLGYETLDEWSCPYHSISIPLHPDHSVSEFKGFFFERRSESSPS
jgi:putative methyltransferase (TIGR04325 family)